MDMNESAQSNVQTLPLLPLRDVVVYPHMVIPLFVGREKSIFALEQAMADDKQILLVAQKQSAVDDPSIDDLYSVGTVAQILQLLKLPDGTVKVLVEGRRRAQITDVTDDGQFFVGHLAEVEVESESELPEQKLAKTLFSRFDAVSDTQ